MTDDLTYDPIVTDIDDDEIYEELNETEEMLYGFLNAIADEVVRSFDPDLFMIPDDFDGEFEDLDTAELGFTIGAEVCAQAVFENLLQLLRTDFDELDGTVLH